MKVVTTDEMRRIEKRDVNMRRFSLNDLVLSVAMTLEQRIIADNPAKVLIVCGPQRNGDYGLQLALLLHNDTGMELSVVCADLASSRYQPAIAQANLAVYDNQRAIRKLIGESDYVVDCLFGIELDQRIGYPYNYWIEWLNAARHFVISVDLPSGLDADDGSLYGCCVRASVTIAIQLPKLGFYLYPGSEYVGQVQVESVGLSYDAVQAQPATAEINDLAAIKGMLPTRTPHSNKGTYGKVLLMAGSQGKTGAAILCGRALLKSGAGLLTIMSGEKTIDAIADNLYEAMSISYNEGNLRQTVDQIDLRRFDLLVIGPGLGRGKDTDFLLQTVLRSELPCVIDADALYFLKDHLDLLSRKPLTVITPHVVEFGRIFDYRPESIAQDLVAISKRYPSLVTVFKGEHTLIAHDGQLTINTTGNDALAKGGSGDVLTGVIGGLMAQKPEVTSVVAGVYVHSLAADYWVRSNSSYSLLASDLIEQIDKVLFDLTRS